MCAREMHYLDLLATVVSPTPKLEWVSGHSGQSILKAQKFCKAWHWSVLRTSAIMTHKELGEFGHKLLSDYSRSHRQGRGL